MNINSAKDGKQMKLIESKSRTISDSLDDCERRLVSTHNYNRQSRNTYMHVDCTQTLFAKSTGVSRLELITTT